MRDGTPRSSGAMHSTSDSTSVFSPSSGYGTAGAGARGPPRARAGKVRQATRVATTARNRPLLSRPPTPRQQAKTLTPRTARARCTAQHAAAGPPAAQAGLPAGRQAGGGTHLCAWPGSQPAETAGWAPAAAGRPAVPRRGTCGDGGQRRGSHRLGERRRGAKRQRAAAGWLPAGERRGAARARCHSLPAWVHASACGCGVGLGYGAAQGRPGHAYLLRSMT